MDYRTRTVDAELDELVASLPAVAIEGAKGVGKTATASRLARTVLTLDDPAVRAVVEAGAGLDLPAPILVDEWQRLPSTWDAVRRRVDAGAPPGNFLLTGSAVPLGVPVHSGAGRIVSMRMRPLSLAERGICEPTVSTATLLRGTRPDVAGTSNLELDGYVDEILASGFPGIRPLPRRARTAHLSGYVDRVVERDFPDQGLRIRRPQTLRAWLTAYAAATATTASYNVILDAASPGESAKPAKTTTIAYRDVLSALWLLDPVPAWTPGNTTLTRLGLSPKHHLADTGLAASLLGVTAESLLAGQPAARSRPHDGPLLGALFESLVTLSVRVYAQANESTVAHLRTARGDHEVDLLILRPDGRVLAIEVKLAPAVDDQDVRHLHWLRERIGDDLLDAVVVTTGSTAYRRHDGVAVVPAALLGP